MKHKLKQTWWVTLQNNNNTYYVSVQANTKAEAISEAQHECSATFNLTTLNNLYKVITAEKNKHNF